MNRYVYPTYKHPPIDFPLTHGDRVRLNEFGLRIRPNYGKKRGTVMAENRLLVPYDVLTSVNVHWDGDPCESRYFESFAVDRLERE
jgi:hypothetical protein